jgi:hypothetical protein
MSSITSNVYFMVNNKSWVASLPFSVPDVLCSQEWDVDPLIPFKPVVEPTGLQDAFLPDEPLQLLQKCPQSIPWLTGINSADGALRAARLYTLIL